MPANSWRDSRDSKQTVVAQRARVRDMSLLLQVRTSLTCGDELERREQVFRACEIQHAAPSPKRRMLVDRGAGRQHFSGITQRGKEVGNEFVKCRRGCSAS